MGASYTDRVIDGKVGTESSSALSITSEVDRTYTSLAQDTTTIVCAGKSRFDVIRDNLDDTVVWNPWREKAAAMSDFEPKDGYKEMLCVEVGAVRDWQTLEPGETYEAGQVLKSHL